MNPIRPELMAKAIELSRLGYPAPNPHVGCVIERDGQVVGEGYHDHAGGPHAEVVALANAGAKAAGATAYVTLEPCNHQGRTGPCSEALIAAGVRRVAIACPDPNPKAAGGAERLREAGVDVIEGLLAGEATEANQAWLTATVRRWPFVVAKAAMSLDGRIALPSGESRWITGETSRQQAHVLRAECGAVLVGRRTVEVDDPLLTVRAVDVVNQPLRIVLDPSGKLKGKYKVFDDSAPSVQVVASQDRAEQLACPSAAGQFDLEDLLGSLYDLGATGVLVEGGGRTVGAFLKAGLVDRLELFLAPKVLGDGPAWVAGVGLGSLAEAPHFVLRNVRQLDQDLWITAVPSTPNR